MKSKILIAGAFVTVFTLSTFATGALRSPRAAGNQGASISGPETATVKCPAIGSPKYVTAAGPAAHTSCCGLTLAQCATMDQMPK